MDVEEEVENKKKLDEQRREGIVKRNDLLQSTKECRRGLKRYKASKIRRKNAQGSCSCQLRDAEGWRGNQRKRGALSAAVEWVIWQPDGSRRRTPGLAGRRGSHASQADDCCLDAVAEQLFTMGAALVRQQLEAMQEKNFR